MNKFPALAIFLLSILLASSFVFLSSALTNSDSLASSISAPLKSSRDQNPPSLALLTSYSEVYGGSISNPIVNFTVAADNTLVIYAVVSSNSGGPVLPSGMSQESQTSYSVYDASGGIYAGVLDAGYYTIEYDTGGYNGNTFAIAVYSISNTMISSYALNSAGDSNSLTMPSGVGALYIGAFGTGGYWSVEDYSLAQIDAVNGGPSPIGQYETEMIGRQSSNQLSFNQGGAVGYGIAGMELTPCQMCSLQVSNFQFISDSKVVPGWINLNDPFSNLSDAANYANNIFNACENSNHQSACVQEYSQNSQYCTSFPPPDQQYCDFGSIPFSLDVTNTGAVTATNVNVTIAVQYELNYFACVIGTSICTTTSELGFGLGPVEVGDSQIFTIGNISPGKTYPLTGTFKITYASVIAYGGELFGDEKFSAVIVGIPISDSIFGASLATQETAFARGSNTNQVMMSATYPIGGLDSAEVGGTILDQACGALDNISNIPCSYMTQYFDSIGQSSSVNSQSGQITNGQIISTIVSIATDNEGAIFTTAYQDNVINLSAISPTGRIYHAQYLGEGIAQLVIKHAEQGNWTVKLTGTNVTGSANYNLSSITLYTGIHTTTSFECSPSEFPVNVISTCTVKVSNPKKDPTPTGAVWFTSTGTGTFSSANCTLTGNGSVSSCKVTFSSGPGSEGNQSLTASYGGDTLHLASEKSTVVKVMQRTTLTKMICSPNSIPIDQIATCTVTVSDTSSGTPISPTGTVNFSTNSSGVFSSPFCSLNDGETSATSSCNVRYVPDSKGQQDLLAIYAGDTDHKASSGVRMIVAEPHVNIVHTVKITISNSQSLPTPAPFQQILIVNSSHYAKWEASDLQNVEFTFQNKTLIHSWLESGASSRSNDTVYWLNLPKGIPAHSNITIDMGFASKTANLFNFQTTGEAPYLSPVFGEYDNGIYVFSVYSNFQGSSIPQGWASQGLATFVGGANATGGEELVSGGNNQEGAISSINNFTQFGSIIEASAMYAASSNAADDFGVGFYSSGPTTNNGQWNPSPSTGYYASYEYYSGSKPALLLNGTAISTSSNQPMPNSGTNYLFTQVYVNESSVMMSFATSQNGMYKGGVYSGLTHTVSYSGRIYNSEGTLYFGASTGGAVSQVNLYWIRIRSAPPNDVMPSVTFPK